MPRGSRKFSWMVSRRSLVSMLGAEYRLMQESGGNVLKKFYWCALLILLIMIVSMCSIFYAVDLLVHNRPVEIVLSVFISMLFILMYIVLLNTFTKENLETRNRWMNLSNMSRIGFVMFMGFIISKPVEIYFLKNKMTQRVAERRTQLFQHHTKKVEAVYLTEINELRRDSTKQQADLLIFATPTLQSDINTVTEKIQRLETERAEAIERSARKINSSSFFIYRVQQASRSWVAWVCCVLIIALFVLPGYIIYSMSADNEYFKRKNAQEKNLVVSEFLSFRIKYASLFTQNFNLHREWYSVFTDPPFNTKRETRPETKTQQSFFQKYLKGQS